MREVEAGVEQKCTFCREELPKTQEEIYQNYMKRAKANDPVAICGLGKRRYREGDYREAFKYYAKAAALGDVESHYELTGAYRYGRGVEKDATKEMYHLEEAAIGGHPKARYNLGLQEVYSGRHDRAAKHFIIAANLGDDNALEAVKHGFQRGLVNKDDYAAVLRRHQAAVYETKSEQRDVADAYYESLNQE